MNVRLFIRVASVMVAALIPVASLHAQQWSAMGTVDFTDGWISPYFTGGDAAVVQAEAEISADGERIRLRHPYSSGSFGAVAGYDTSGWGSGRYIEFDISDETWVTVSAPCEAVTLPAGVFDEVERPLWVTSRGLYMHSLGYDRDAVAAAGLNATFEGGKIIIPQCMVSFGPEENALTQSLGDTPVFSVIDLTTAGVPSDFAASTEDTPVRYFTIDGRPVQEIRIPGIYLQCRGSSVYKTVVR